MEKFRNLKRYILEEEFKITIVEKRINIVNYTSLGHFDDHQIMIYNENQIIVIKGDHLSVTKLLNDEILIVGNIKNIEFR